MFSATTPILRSAAFLALAGALAGCSTLPPPKRIQSAMTPTDSATIAAPSPVCFDGHTGAVVDWDNVVERLAKAEIVLVGEQHDNVAGHRLEAELTDALLSHQPRAAVALEMFERHEQGLVDLHLDGRIATTTLTTLTESENWGGGKNTWMEWYQPIVDHVKARRAAGAALVAANAPRAHVKLARIEGFEALAQLPESERALFALPDPAVDDSAYRERFFATMQHHSAPAPTQSPAQKPYKLTTVSLYGQSSPPPMRADPEAFFRAQQLWDATMAGSVVLASQRHPQVLLFVGEFHLAREGGTYQRIRHALPGARIATVSILRSAMPEAFVPGDRDRADFVVYTRAPE